MEMLTVATLEHLPTASLFVLDLTEGCGCSVQDQWEIRRELLQRFPYKLWIDVITKADLLEEEIDEAQSLGPGTPPNVQAVRSQDIFCDGRGVGRPQAGCSGPDGRGELGLPTFVCASTPNNV